MNKKFYDPNYRKSRHIQSGGFGVDIQHLNITLTAFSGTISNHTISAVDPANTYLDVVQEDVANGGSDSRSLFTVDLTSSTNTRLERGFNAYTTDKKMTIRVMEFAPDIIESKEKVEISYTNSGDYTNIAAINNTDLTKSIIKNLGMHANNISPADGFLPLMWYFDSSTQVSATDLPNTTANVTALCEIIRFKENIT